MAQKTVDIGLRIEKAPTDDIREIERLTTQLWGELNRLDIIKKTDPRVKESEEGAKGEGPLLEINLSL
jgi:hypothetical protein